MRPARRLADVCDAVAAFGPGFRVVGLTEGKVMLRPLEAIPGPQARLEVAARAEALGLRVSWGGRCGIVARRVRWPSGAPREREAPGASPEGRPRRRAALADQGADHSM